MTTPEREVEALKKLYYGLQGWAWLHNDRWGLLDPCFMEWYGVRCVVACDEGEAEGPAAAADRERLRQVAEEFRAEVGPPPEGARVLRASEDGAQELLEEEGARQWAERREAAFLADALRERALQALFLPDRGRGDSREGRSLTEGVLDAPHLWRANRERNSLWLDEVAVVALRREAARNATVARALAQYMEELPPRGEEVRAVPLWRWDGFKARHLEERRRRRVALEEPLRQAARRAMHGAGGLLAEGLPTCSFHVGGLWLQANNLTGPFPRLAPYPEMRQVLLYINRLTGTLPLELWNSNVTPVPWLSQLLVQANSLHGEFLPGEVPPNQQLVNFNVALNNLEGTIPFTISNFLNLEELNLRSNPSISGTLPSQVLLLKKLALLILDNCSLQGTFPLLDDATVASYLRRSLNGSLPPHSVSSSTPSREHLQRMLERLRQEGDVMDEGNVEDVGGNGMDDGNVEDVGGNWMDEGNVEDVGGNGMDEGNVEDVGGNWMDEGNVEYVGGNGMDEGNVEYVGGNWIDEGNDVTHDEEMMDEWYDECVEISGWGTVDPIIVVDYDCRQASTSSVDASSSSATASSSAMSWTAVSDEELIRFVSEAGIETGLVMDSLRTMQVAWNDFDGKPLEQESLSLYSKLERLSLKGNAFTGTVREDISRQLGELEFLVLSYCEFRGSFPTDLDGFRKMEFFHINSNHFGPDLPDLSSLNATLLIADLSLNDVSAAHFPEWICGDAAASPGERIPLANETVPNRFDNLTVINLSRLNIVGTIPACAWTLPNLGSMRLASTLINSTIPPVPSDVPECVAPLYGLNFQMCKFVHGQMPDSLGFLWNMQNFSISDSGLSGTIPKSICAWTMLENLQLRAEGLEGELVLCDTWLTQLHDLSIGGSMALWGELDDSICLYNDLHTLSLSEMSLTGTIPPCVQNLKYLYSLELFATGISGTVPPELCQMSEVRRFLLDRTNLEGQLPDCWGNATKMVHFMASRCRLTGSIPPSLFFPPKMYHLDLQNNMLDRPLVVPAINDGCTTEVYDSGNFFSLSKLHINSNYIPSMHGVETLCRMQSIRAFDNLLQGTIPEKYSLLRYLQYLWMSENYLVGTIPEEFGLRMDDLNAVRLDHNYLTGTIPSLLQYSKVETLNLASNLLEGTLVTEDPVAMAKILNYKMRVHDHELSHKDQAYLEGGHSIALPGRSLPHIVDLDLSHNRLEGTIPWSWFGDNCYVMASSTGKIQNSLTQVGVCQRPTITTLTLCHNHFLSGPFPSAVIAEPEQLHLLDLAGNPAIYTLKLPSDIDADLRLNVNQPEFHRNGTYCLPYEIELATTLDPSFYNYTNCFCNEGLWGNPPFFPCLECLPNGECPFTESAILWPSGFYPILRETTRRGSWFSSVLRSPDSILSPSPPSSHRHMFSKSSSSRSISSLSSSSSRSMSSSSSSQSMSSSSGSMSSTASSTALSEKEMPLTSSMTWEEKKALKDMERKERAMQDALAQRMVALYGAGQEEGSARGGGASWKGRADDDEAEVTYYELVALEPCIGDGTMCRACNFLPGEGFCKGETEEETGLAVLCEEGYEDRLCSRCWEGWFLRGTPQADTLVCVECGDWKDYVLWVCVGFVLVTTVVVDGVFGWTILLSVCELLLALALWQLNFLSISAVYIILLMSAASLFNRLCAALCRFLDWLWKRLPWAAEQSGRSPPLLGGDGGGAASSSSAPSHAAGAASVHRIRLRTIGGGGDSANSLPDVSAVLEEGGSRSDGGRGDDHASRMAEAPAGAGRGGGRGEEEGEEEEDPWPMWSGDSDSEEEEAEGGEKVGGRTGEGEEEGKRAAAAAEKAPLNWEVSGGVVAALTLYTQATDSLSIAAFQARDPLGLSHLQMGGPECLSDFFDYYGKFCFFLLLPAAICAALFLMYHVGRLYFRCRRMPVPHWKSKCMFTAALIVTILYEDVVEQVMQVFSCYEAADGNFYMQNAPYIQCWQFVPSTYDDPIWAWLFWTALLATVVYIVGIPVIMLLLLNQVRYFHSRRREEEDADAKEEDADAKEEDADAKEEDGSKALKDGAGGEERRKEGTAEDGAEGDDGDDDDDEHWLSFLCEDYREDRWWWAFVNLLQMLVVAYVGAFFGNSIYLLPVVTCVFLVCIWLQHFFEPNLSRLENAVFMLSYSVVIAQFNCEFVAAFDDGASVWDTLSALLNASVLVMFFILMVRPGFTIIVRYFSQSTISR